MAAAMGSWAFLPGSLQGSREHGGRKRCLSPGIPGHVEKGEPGLGECVRPFLPVKGG